MGVCDAGHGQGAVNMDLLNAWGSVSDMTTLEQRVGEFTNDSGPLQVGFRRLRFWGFSGSFEFSLELSQDSQECRDAQPCTCHGPFAVAFPGVCLQECMARMSLCSLSRDLFPSSS